MTRLITQTNLTQHDDLYAEIVSLFDDQSDEQSLKSMAKLVLILANHIGDENIVSDAVSLVRASAFERKGENDAQ